MSARTITAVKVEMVKITPPKEARKPTPQLGLCRTYIIVHYAWNIFGNSVPGGKLVVISLVGVNVKFRPVKKKKKKTKKDIV